MGILKTDKPKVGERVVYRSPEGDGPDDGLRGTITEVIGYHYAVEWDGDDDRFTYTMNMSSSVWLLRASNAG